MQNSEHRLEVMFVRTFDRRLNRHTCPPLSRFMDQYNGNDLGCQINLFLFAAALPATDHVPSSVDVLSSAFVPWDHVLDPAETIWILVAELSVYQAL